MAGGEEQRNPLACLGRVSEYRKTAQGVPAGGQGRAGHLALRGPGHSGSRAAQLERNRRDQRPRGRTRRARGARTTGATRPSRQQAGGRKGRLKLPAERTVIRFPPRPQTPVSNGPAGLPAALPAVRTRPALPRNCSRGRGQRQPASSKNNPADGVKKPTTTEQRVPEGQEGAALCPPSPADPPQCQAGNVCCPRRPATAPGPRPRTQPSPGGHRICKRPVSFTGHQLQEKVFVKSTFQPPADVAQNPPADTCGDHNPPGKSCRCWVQRAESGGSSPRGPLTSLPRGCRANIWRQGGGGGAGRAGGLHQLARAWSRLLGDKMQHHNRTFQGLALPLGEPLLAWQHTPATAPSLLARKSSQHHPPPPPSRWQKPERIPRAPV